MIARIFLAIAVYSVSTTPAFSAFSAEQLKLLDEISRSPGGMVDELPCGDAIRQHLGNPKTLMMTNPRHRSGIARKLQEERSLSFTVEWVKNKTVIRKEMTCYVSDGKVTAVAFEPAN